jgi:SAM-dependent methyltransferase
MKEKRYYDPVGKQLVYCWKRPSPRFWDNHWQSEEIKRAITGQSNWFVIRVTRRYLSLGSRVIEGGCGLGDKVYALQRAGFEAFGVDFAADTVRLVHRNAPELKIVESDVREMPFRDGSFDGYWSLGVIEHFLEGYHSIASEMARVIRPGGYLFLAFPYMSPLRVLKATMGLYPMLKGSGQAERGSFYQYALNAGRVVENMGSRGFRLVHKIGLGGVKGLKDEISILRPGLQRLFNSRGLPARAARLMLDIALFSHCGHSVLLIMRNEM